MANNEYYYCVVCDNNHRMNSQIGKKHRKQAKKRKTKRSSRK
ncbi:hypothetical protein LCGC14_1119490 [marine sediment metagenome]|uniref:Uncharacterized protein n=1 Tax=marine sediment metagenome TaxID=412755 RepID=A0A0F9PMM6_9ZZZZ